ncbi:IS4 family transposase, partial [Candidatus Parcubacteria bacterium]
MDWVFNDDMFANLRVHGNASWTPVTLVRLAIFWVWSAESTLAAAAEDAIACVARIFGEAPLRSYQASTKALKRYTDPLLPIIWNRLQRLMKRCDEGAFRVGLWLALAMDGSRVSVPRTLSNEQRFCKPKPKRKRKKGKKAKKRGRHAKRRKAPTHKKSHYNPQAVGPQMWLTMIWHIGQRLPWCWKTGPSYSSERQHVMEMLEEHEFPENTLFCGDAGFVGYDFWRAIADRGYHFLVRVGGNVRLLNKLGHFREHNGIVYSWPD